MKSAEFPRQRRSVAEMEQQKKRGAIGTMRTSARKIGRKSYSLTGESVALF
jgi:hypothetical protein